MQVFYRFLAKTPISSHANIVMVKTAMIFVFSGSQGDDLIAGHLGWHTSGEPFSRDLSPDWWLLLLFKLLPQHPVTTTAFIPSLPTRSISIDIVWAPASSFELHAVFSYPVLHLSISAVGFFFQVPIANNCLNKKKNVKLNINTVQW